MRLTKIPSEERQELHYKVEHDHGVSHLVLELWIERLAGFCHRLTAWSMGRDDARNSEAESDEFIASPLADIRKEVLTRLPELLGTRPSSNHTLMGMSKLLDEIEMIEESLRPDPHPMAT